MPVKIVDTIVLLYAAYRDWKTMQVKDWIPIAVILLALFEHLSVFPCQFAEAVLITAPFLYVAVKTNQLGGGDIKFIFANACMLGLQKTYAGLLIGFGMVAFLYQIKKMIGKNVNEHRKIPLLPYLVTGFLLEMFR
ncbi:A24 family peptidase [Anaeromicropila populeti]|uniref:Type IV leader peptidase family protein n=1 Tax=Anaeromicropila populeti TaxID=37658 RepID=A0A1I6JF99_9FIRM|nr:A24 family peptidase [Anaeromicropila populeti]SFR77651.1 Type IV leader peptidase family protein [Anaeromicropila populeti]